MYAWTRKGEAHTCASAQTFTLAWLQDLVKNKVLHKVTDEHGLVFQDRLAASIGIMLGMEPEPPAARDSVMIFKFVAAAEGSIDFWRQLSAGMVIGRYTKAWMQRRRAERVARAEAERRSAMEDPMALDIGGGGGGGSLMMSLPAGGDASKPKKSKSRAPKAKVVAVVEDGPSDDGRAETLPKQESDAGNEAQEDADKEEGEEKAKERKKAAKKGRVDEGVAYLGAEAPKKGKGKSKDRQKKEGDGGAEDPDPQKASETKGKKGGVADEGGATAEAGDADAKADKKKKSSKKGKDDVRQDSQSLCCVQ